MSSAKAEDIGHPEAGFRSFISELATNRPQCLSAAIIPYPKQCHPERSEGSAVAFESLRVSLLLNWRQFGHNSDACQLSSRFIIVSTVPHFEFRMKSLHFCSVLCAALILAPSTAAFSAEDDLSGFTLSQLDTAIKSSGAATQKIFSILTFDSEDRNGSSIAILSGSRLGWQVTVLHRATGGLKVEWHSAKLSDDFSNSSSNNLKIEVVEDEQVVEFSGCAQHQCGGVDGVLGVLLYSPRCKQAFFAHYRFDEHKPIGSFGSLEFSKNAHEPGNERYLEALRNAMNKTLH